MIVTLLTSCNSKFDFKAGDCIDHHTWVTELGKLNGNGYLKIIGKAQAGNFLVVRCSGEGSLLNGKGELKNIKCGRMADFTILLEEHDQKIEDYTKIECPYEEQK